MTRTFKRAYTSRKVKLERKEITYLVPVMVYLDSMPNDKVLYRYLFPENSEIASFMINFEGLKDKMEIIADLKVEGGGEYIDFEVSDGINKLLESKGIAGGTTVKLSVPDYDESTHGNPQIWISYLYKVLG